MSSLHRPALLACAFAAGALASGVRAQPAPALALRVPVPPAAVVVNDRDTYTYELHLANTGDAPLTLAAVEFRPVPLQPFMTYTGDGLARALDPPADPAAPLVVPPRGVRVVYVDLSAQFWNHGARVHFDAFRHRVRARNAAGDEVVVDDGEGVRVDSRAPVVLGPPLAGGPWAAVYHSDWPRGHRRVFYTVDGVTRLPGRHTIDFVKLDDQGRTAADADVVAAVFGYGADVLAVADATVAATRDGMAEPARVSAREQRHADDAAAGNFVSLDLGDGRFAVYEHLKTSSVKVRQGQRVRRGDVIAALGFSGSSTGPHLHLHVGDAASPLAAEGRPFGFDAFRVSGRYADVGVMGRARWLAEGVGARTNQRPSPMAVVDFGPARRSPDR